MEMKKSKMNIEDLVGATIISVNQYGDSYKIETTKGMIEVGMGDCGTIRNPEPYFSFRVLPKEHCTKWFGFGICGQELPCDFHTK